MFNVTLSVHGHKAIFIIANHSGVSVACGRGICTHKKVMRLF